MGRIREIINRDYIVIIIVLFVCACTDSKKTEPAKDSYNKPQPTYTPPARIYYPPVQPVPRQPIVAHETTPDDAYSEGYEQGYEQGKYDGIHGYSHGYSYDDSNNYYDYYDTRYKEGYEEGYDDGFYEGQSHHEEIQDNEGEEGDEDEW